MQPEQPARFVFLDVEATGLDHGRHEMTEIAWIVRHEDGREEERQFFPHHTTDGADADALALTRYEERIAPRRRTPMNEWLPLFLRDADGAIIVGAVPDFDVRHLEKACAKQGVQPTWDHHLLDVETLALPLIATGPERPRSLARTCEALGVSFDRDQAHGALYDARLAKAVFDRVWELLAALGADESVVERLPSPDASAEPNARRDPDASAESEARHDSEAAEGSSDPVPGDQETVGVEPAPQPAQPKLDVSPPGPMSDADLVPEPEVYEARQSTNAAVDEAIAAVEAEPEVLPLPDPSTPQQATPEPVASLGPIEPFAAPDSDVATSGAERDAVMERRHGAPLVEEAVTVLPAEGVEDQLFGGQRKKVGHPNRHDDED